MKTRTERERENEKKRKKKTKEKEEQMRVSRFRCESAIVCARARVRTFYGSTAIAIGQLWLCVAFYEMYLIVCTFRSAFHFASRLHERRFETFDCSTNGKYQSHPGITKNAARQIEFRAENVVTRSGKNAVGEAMPCFTAISRKNFSRFDYALLPMRCI